MMYAHAIAQVEPPAVGVHLIWMGPSSWIYAPAGWSIQRRSWREKGLGNCDSLDANSIKELRSSRATRLRFGLVTLRDGIWPTPLASSPAQVEMQHTNCDIFTLTLDTPQPRVSVSLKAGEGFALALREGKAVSVAGPRTDLSELFTGIAIDQVVVYTLDAISLEFCISTTEIFDEEASSWQNAPYIVRGLQMPLQELQPALHTPDLEYDQALSRLLPGEALNKDDFVRLANTLRPGVAQANALRPIDQILLLREDLESNFEEMCALDPLRILLVEPRWRRVLGFGFFDADRALVPGETYEYRITGTGFPRDDLSDTVYGFHTVPSQTLLPTDFYLNDLHMRLPQPTPVTLAPAPPNNGKLQLSRRGIALGYLRQSFWLIPSLEEACLVIDLPRPIRTVVLELFPDHNLTYSAVGQSIAPFFTQTLLVEQQPVAAGSRVILSFPGPVEQLRLQGTGFLYAIRIPNQAPGPGTLSVILPPVRLVNQARPAPPLKASISNLQKSLLGFPLQPVPTPRNQPITASPRHSLGFEVTWRPAPQDGLTIWPTDQDAAPLVEATLYQLEHRQGTDAGAVSQAQWTPVLTDDNLVLGDRDSTGSNAHITTGDDLMAFYPEVRRRQPGAGLDIFWRDVFDIPMESRNVVRPVPPPGTYHQYRVFTIDAIGRPSPGARETNILRLEKHVPPPVPVGPDELPAASLALPAPTGVQARVLVQGAPDLSSADQALLGSDQNAIVLRWGWHATQRNLDPYAREFRLYVASGPLDVVAGTLTNVVSNVTPFLAQYIVTLNLERAVVANVTQGLYLEAGYSFFIQAHTAGSTITAVLEALVPTNGSWPTPAVGPILLPLRLSTDMTRPPAWTARTETQPITQAESYQAVFRNRLTLSAGHARDAVWVGVSAADDQSYVLDQLAPLQNRLGNESGIVPVRCEGRYHGRPVFLVPPQLTPVPVVVTPEPASRPITFSLDLRPYLTGLSGGDLIWPERAAADTIFAAYYATGDGRIMARVVNPSGSEAEQEISLPNPIDQTNVLAALRAANTQALEDRFVVYLANRHPYRDRFFEAVLQNAVPLGPFQETLPPKSGRFVYRVLKADQVGHLSEGDEVAKLIVRIPSLVAGGAPEQVSSVPPAKSLPPGTLQLRITPGQELTHLLTFTQVTTPDNSGLLDEADVLRVPNRPDLYRNGGGIVLRLSNGTLLPPQVKALSDPDVLLDGDGFRRVTLNFTGNAGERIHVWACTITRDGIPSYLGGPWSLPIPVAPLPVPILSIQVTGQDLHFTWPALNYTVALQRSQDEQTWERVSPLLTTTQFTYTPSPGSWKYRLVVISPDGRTQYSGNVTH